MEKQNSFKVFPMKLPTKEQIAAIGSLLSGFGGLFVGFAACIALWNADQTFDKIVELDQNLREIRSLNIEIKNTLNLVREDIKKASIEKSGAETIILDRELMPEEVDEWMSKIPSTWQEAIKTNSSLFITEENRGHLREQLLTASASSNFKREVIEHYSIPTLKAVRAFVKINSQGGVTITRDDFALLSGKQVSEINQVSFYIGEGYAKAPITCLCLPASKKCSFDQNKKAFVVEHNQEDLNYELSCKN